MKYGVFIAIVLVVLIGVGLYLGRMTDKSYEEGYEAGSSSVLENQTSYDHLERARSADGLDGILSYVNDKDPDAIFDYLREHYAPEDLSWVRDAADDGYEAGRSSILDEWTLYDYMSFLEEKYGTYGVMDYLHSKYRVLYPEEASNLYVYAFSSGYRSALLGAWNDEIEEYVDGYLFSKTEADFYRSFAPYAPSLNPLLSR